MVMRYPMYVVSVRDFMLMSEVFPHQTLLAIGSAVELRSLIRPGYEPTAVFVSHQWSGRDNADPHFRQLRVLQRCFERMADGSLRIEVDLNSMFTFKQHLSVSRKQLRHIMEYYIWFDYFSVPQPAAPQAQSNQHTDFATDLGKAVSSLPAYVSACEFFVVLAPPILHDDGFLIDYSSWKTRGWCRLERFARVMADRPVNMLFLKSESHVLEVGPQGYLLDGVATGEFSVEHDRDSLSVIVRGLLDHKFLSLVQSGRMHEYRRLMSLRPIILDGVMGQWSSFDSELGNYKGKSKADRFMHLMHLSSPTAYAEGTAPMLLACSFGDVSAVQALLESRASIACREKHMDPEFLVLQGQQPIHHACRFGHLCIVSLLLEHRADINARDRFKGTPLHAAASQPTGRNALIVSQLVELRADVNARNAIGSAPLDIAVVYQASEVVRVLLAAGASVSDAGDGIGPLQRVAAFGSGPVIGGMLLAAKASVQSHAHFRRCGVQWLTFSALALAHRCGRNDFLSAFADNVWGASPMAVAVMHGNVVEARMLLEWRADPNERNARGASVTDLARKFGVGEDEAAWLFAATH